jgi:S1-C subfamily serine protease
MLQQKAHPLYLHHQIESHRTHRNVLYSLVIVLAILQIISFTIFTIQLSKLNVKIDTEAQQTSSDLKTYTKNLVETYDKLYQENFRGITQILNQQEENIASQQQSFEEQIKLLKSSQADFSGVVEDVVKGVVAVSTQSSVGSGFVVTPSGYVVTNYHVISGSESDVKVVTYDKKVIPAEFIGGDESRDLALLKLSGEFNSLELADSDDLQPGQKVIAIGNPLGLSFSVTEGIISAVNRQGPNGLAEYVQTDVSLNPGNSGGPLIDTRGKVVGINNFKIGGAESLGFALESNSIKSGINQIANETIIN